jgi:hypothetical protein
MSQQISSDFITAWRSLLGGDNGDFQAAWNDAFLCQLQMAFAFSQALVHDP